MNKFIIIIGVAFTVLATSSCRRVGYCKKGKESKEMETRDVGSFTGINSEGAWDVTIEQDFDLSSPYVEVVAPRDLMEYIETSVSGNVLTIETKKCFRGDNDITIHVKMKEIENITLKGSGNIESVNELQAEDLMINLEGSGKFDLDVDADEIQTTISGSGDIDLFGTTDWNKTRIDGSGAINNFNLEADHTTADIKGSGTIQVYANETLDIDIDGSGLVEYKGNATVTQNISGSGEIKNRN